MFANAKKNHFLGAILQIQRKGRYRRYCMIFKKNVSWARLLIACMFNRARNELGHII